MQWLHRLTLEVIEKLELDAGQLRSACLWNRQLSTMVIA